MKKLYFTILYLITFLNFANSQSGWMIQNSGLNSNLNSVIILDSNYFIAAGESENILVSTNGGNLWTIIFNPIFPVDGINDIDFVSDDIGFMLSDYDLYKTTNKGYNWIKIHRPLSVSYNQNLDFINELTGYVCGADDSPSAYVNKTTNGGVNWIRYWMNDIGNASNIKFFDTNNGAAFVCNRLHYTTNGGVNWTNRMSPYNCLNSMFSINSNSHFAFNDYGKIHKTENAGVNWIEQSSGTTKDILNSFFLDSLTGYAIGDSGLILRTTNGGINWTIQYSNTFEKLTDIFFIDNDIGIIVGEGGIILKTTTGGLTFVSSTSGIVPENFSLSQHYPNPFNPKTKLEFGIPASRGESNVGFVSLKVFDMLGKEVAILINEKLSPENYSVDFNGEGLPSGVYFYKLEAGSFIETKRMILLK